MSNKDPWYNTEETGKGSLDYISIALLGACDMKCIFCYVDGDRPGIWNPEELKPLFEEAHDLGMEKIQLSGGEPLIYPYLEPILDNLSRLEVDILLATNATRITPQKAELLAKHKVKVGVSMETIDEAVSDGLSGVSGSHAKKLEGIETLRNAGYTHSKDLPLNMIMKTLKQNFSTYIDTWKWAKEQGIQPILDRAIPGDRCKLEWVVEPSELRYLLDEIGKIEGIYHRIPFVNNEGCNRMGSSVHIEVDGSVYPCGGIPVSMGNVKKESLTRIWNNSELAIHLRNYKSRITGTCKSCDEVSVCCGCRAVAYATTGNMFGPDTLCWNYNKGK
ncbi:MAG: radical SAM protein [Candidatus Daviesbacteria bacterium]|nr:radical SAM protein [Candidatus Daviesbacteria bacterium]